MTDETSRLITSLQKKNEELESRLESLTNEKDRTIELLKEELAYLRQRLYGRKSERFVDPNQLDLPELLEGLEEKAATEPEALERITYSRRRPKKKGPRPFPEDLPREDIHVDPPEEERICACCSKQMERVDEVVTEELEIVPPQFRVRRYIQGKFRCKTCMNRDKIKPLPRRPIQKGRPSPSLLASIVTSKYADHLPLNRQEQIFKRHGIHLPRSTMDEWLGALSPLLKPIVEVQKEGLLRRGYLQLDETPIQAKDHEHSQKMRRCYIWSYGVPAGEVVYDVTPSRSSRGPRNFLNGFCGHLQVDGYAGFNELFRSGEMIRISCLAHIRRKFKEAQHALPEQVEEILQLIRNLYDLEREARENGLSFAQRGQLRAEKARPIFSKLKEKIDALRPIPAPKSKLGKAIEYAISQWQPMERYLDIGEVEIDNNHCENSIRPVALGRRNYLFLGSIKGGGERASVFYSLVQTCRRLKIDPFAYLSSVIEKIVTHPKERIGELTPRGWRESQARAPTPG